MGRRGGGVARVEVGKQCLADGDIVGAAVVVELLVPLLHHATLAVVAALDGQDLVADALALVAIAAAADGAECERRHLARPRAAHTRKPRPSAGSCRTRHCSAWNTRCAPFNGGDADPALAVGVFRVNQTKATAST